MTSSLRRFDPDLLLEYVENGHSVCQAMLSMGFSNDNVAYAYTKKNPDYRARLDAARQTAMDRRRDRGRYIIDLAATKAIENLKSEEDQASSDIVNYMKAGSMMEGKEENPTVVAVQVNLGDLNKRIENLED